MSLCFNTDHSPYAYVRSTGNWAWGSDKQVPRKDLQTVDTTPNSILDWIFDGKLFAIHPNAIRN